MPMLNRAENDARIAQIWAEIQFVAPKDMDALDIICNQWNAEDPLRCYQCGTRVVRNQGRRNVGCRGCGKTTSVTSQTLLCKARRFKAYLLACLIREAGLNISGPALSRLTTVAHATAYNLVRKFNLAICNQIPTDAQEISARFFENLIAKRSRLTPADMHPLAEQEVIELNMEEIQLTEEVETEVEGEAETGAEDDPEVAKKIIYNILSNDPQSADTISDKTEIAIGLVTGCLIMLQLDGKVIEMPGNRYIKKELSVVEQYLLSNAALADSVTMAVDKLTIQIKKYHHRVSRKGLQLFFAQTWCSIDRERWGAGSVVRLCRSHPPIGYPQMLKYSSPPLIKIMLC